MKDYINIIGGGLAGCEAAYQISKRGINVRLYEMKPTKYSPAHSNSNLAEIVCSNSFKSNLLTNACGLLKEELRMLDSLLIKIADETSVPAGQALAVDREEFSRKVTEYMENLDNVEIIKEEVTEIQDDAVTIIATGPLTSDVLFEKISKLVGNNELHFYDAAAPIIEKSSVDMNIAFIGDRYGKGEADYINLPMNKEEYETFYNALISAERAPLHDCDVSNPKVYEGCMPVEVMARRGEDTLRYGPLKPVGLRDPRTGKDNYAVVQLRRDNAEGTLYNIVGFQTHLTFGEQKRVFSMIPALREAEFVRYGVMHRNTYLDSPRLLDRYYRLRGLPRLSFAGQMTGVEGYVESAASGMLVGIETAARVLGLPAVDFPQETAIGALALYVSGGSVGSFQPMNVNFGIISPLGYRVKGKRNKNAEISRRSLELLGGLMETKEVLRS